MKSPSLTKKTAEARYILVVSLHGRLGATGQGVELAHKKCVAISKGVEDLKKTFI